MAVESATSYSELDKDAPAQSDPGSDLGGHTRLVKGVMQSQWPGSAGAGLDRPMQVTEGEIESLQGAVGAIQPQINALETGKINTVPGAIAGNLAVFDSTGNLIDSGIPSTSITG